MPNAIAGRPLGAAPPAGRPGTPKVDQVERDQRRGQGNPEDVELDRGRRGRSQRRSTTADEASCAPARPRRARPTTTGDHVRVPDEVDSPIALAEIAISSPLRARRSDRRSSGRATRSGRPRPPADRDRGRHRDRVVTGDPGDRCQEQVEQARRGGGPDRRRGAHEGDHVIGDQSRRTRACPGPGRRPSCRERRARAGATGPRWRRRRTGSEVGPGDPA